MSDSNQQYENPNNEENSAPKESNICYIGSSNMVSHVPVVMSTDIENTSMEVEENQIIKNRIESSCIEDASVEKDGDSKNHLSDSVQEVCESVNNDQRVETCVNSELETFSNKIPQLNKLPENENNENMVESDRREAAVIKKIFPVPEAFTDNSQSLGLDLQSSGTPFESSYSSHENNFNSVRMNFEKAIESSGIWSKPSNSPEVIEIKEESSPVNVAVAEQPDKLPDAPQEFLVKTDESTQPPLPEVIPIAGSEMSSFVGSGFPPPIPGIQDQTSANQIQGEIKIEQPPLEPPPVPIIPPAPRKRGRPRKQVLPNPSPLVESWGPNAQEFPSLEVKQEEKRPGRPERRQTKRRRFEEEEKERQEAETHKRRFVVKPPVKKTKRRAIYTPKKKLPPPKKKRSEMENIQNFEEETRMSASEGAAGYSSRSGIGDESQGSSVTAEGHTRSNINKKGRMEVMTDGCKPVTVQQIVEYFWPPPSALPHGEKPEGLMIQEQISEYLGVKSFKRKYPSIKRRPVDMEERNYLQENGYVSENMCDMGLTAVFSADIIEIMYNDFPQKFEEYRKYTREKKAKEQRALREKQAAERADMDPQKEAVESAYSWNNELNKTRSILKEIFKEMDRPKRNYNSKVLLGHWFDKNCDDEYRLAMYLKKKDRRDLLITGVRKLFENFLKDVPLILSTKGSSYGDTIQLLAPDVVAAPATSAEKPRDGLVLSVTIDSTEIDRTQTIINDLALVGSPLREPCARNTFIIESTEGKKHGEEVCYGDTFTLKSAGGTEIPLYVEVPVATLGAPTGKCGLPNPKLVVSRGTDTRFKVLHPNLEMRFSTDGAPVRPFEKLIIMHAPDNCALCIENEHWKMSLFTYECEISVNNKMNMKKEYSSQNLWVFVAGEWT